MNLTFEQLKAIDSESIYIELSEKDLKTVGNNQEKYSNHYAQNNAQINYLCYQKILPWIEENIEPEESIQPFPSEQEYSQLWGYINGSALDVTEVRIIIVPSENYDTKEFSVPQEWVDIPKFAGNYYLAVQIDLEAKWLRIWGFTTHKTLKQEAYYDSVYRNYSLDRDYVIDDLEVMWLAKEMEAEDKLTVANLSPAMASESDTLLDKLSQVSPFSPRLDVSFEQWAMILSDDNLRPKLSEKRLSMSLAEKSVSRSNFANPLKNIVMETQKTVVDLSKWLEKDFTDAIESGWKIIDRTIDEFVSESPQFAYRHSIAREDEENKLEGVKLYKLKGSVAEITVALSVVLIPEENNNIGIYLDVRPILEQTYLPPNLQVNLLCDGEQLEKMISQQQNSILQSDYYSVSTGTEFQIQVLFENDDFIEKFTI